MGERGAQTGVVEHAPTIFILALGVCLLGVSVFAFDSFPHSADEYASVYQAQTFLEGRLSNPAMGEDTTLVPNHINFHDGIKYSKYPPGWAAVLAVGELFGLRGWINPILATLLLFLVFRLVDERVGRAPAYGSVILLASSSFFVLNVGSLFPHVLTALLAFAACDATWKYCERPERRGLVLISLFVILGVLTRPFTGALVAAVLLPFVVVTVWRDLPRRWPDAAAGLAVVLAGVAFYLFYNAATTGDAFMVGHLKSRFRYLDEFGGFRPGVLAAMSEDYTAVALPLAVPLLSLGYLIAERAVFPRWTAGAALGLVVVIWAGHCFRMGLLPISYGPRYVFATHAVLVIVTVCAVFHASRKWRFAAPAVLALFTCWQLWNTVLHTRELSLVIDEAQSVYRAREALEKLVPGDVTATLFSAGPSGSMPEDDQPRNHPSLIDRVLLRVNSKNLPAGRWVYVYDGAPSAPALLAANMSQSYQGLVVTPDGAVILEERQAGGWLEVSTQGECGDLTRRLRGLRDVDGEPYRGRYCGSRDVFVRFTDEDSWSVRGHSCTVVRRAFVEVEGPGKFFAKGSPNLHFWLNGHPLKPFPDGNYHFEFVGSSFLTIIDLGQDGVCEGRFAFDGGQSLTVTAPRPVRDSPP